MQRSRNLDGAYNISQVEDSELCDYKGKSRVPFHSAVGIFAVSEGIAELSTTDADLLGLNRCPGPYTQRRSRWRSLWKCTK